VKKVEGKRERERERERDRERGGRENDVCQASWSHQSESSNFLI
jgi:hypothetical protein